MPRVVVRRQRPSDAAALAQVYTDAFGPTTAAQVRRHRRDVPYETFVATVDGTVAAAVTIEYLTLLVDGVPIRTGGIAGVATRWDYRRRGLATRVLDVCHRRLRERGISNATLFTGRNLPAIRIYERTGYSEVADWVRFLEVRDPVRWIGERFVYRSEWLPRTPFGRETLQGWEGRVLIVTPRWSCTITLEGKRFHVRPGRRGRPTVIMRGDAEAVLDCFGNRLHYDASLRSGRVTLRGPLTARGTWRRVLTLEWRE